MESGRGEGGRGSRWHRLGEDGRRPGPGSPRILEESADLARAGWRVKQLIAEERYEFLLLDEITYPINWGWIDLVDVLETLRTRPGFQHVVLTGRNAPDELVAAADLVSEVARSSTLWTMGSALSRGSSGN